MRVWITDGSLPGETRQAIDATDLGAIGEIAALTLDASQPLIMELIVTFGASNQTRLMRSSKN